MWGRGRLIFLDRRFKMECASTSRFGDTSGRGLPNWHVAVTKRGRRGRDNGDPAIASKYLGVPRATAKSTKRYYKALPRRPFFSWAVSNYIYSMLFRVRGPRGRPAAQ